MRFWKRKQKEPVKQDVTPTLRERFILAVKEYDSFYENDDAASGLSYIKEWMKTLRNSELIDIVDMTLDEEERVTIWDYSQILNEYDNEMKSRCIPKSQELIDLLNDYHPEWIGKDSFVKKLKNIFVQVEGLQKKVDNIMKVLSKFDVTLSAQEAVELAKQ